MREMVIEIRIIMAENLNFDRASDGICANSKVCADENPKGRFVAVYH